MTFRMLLDCLPDIQPVMLMGDGICTNLKTDAETLGNVLNESVLNSKVTDIEAEENVLKVWVEDAHDA